MVNVETLGMLDEIQALISDKLQVVSYKWLSRQYLVSSNAAKRLLQEFVEKNVNQIEAVYTLAGWQKSTPPSYHIRLVSGAKLEEAKLDFDGNCSIQVYSVQACIPKDPAALWNAEFVQAEEFFKQPVGVDNCLRDNRFCGVINSCVKRNVEGYASSIAALQPKCIGVPGSSKSSAAQNITVPPPQQISLKESGPKDSLKSPNEVENVKTESNGTGICDQATKPPANKEKVLPVPANKHKVKNDKTASGTGGAIANLWGRASAKSKPPSPSADKNDLHNLTDAQISAHEELEDGSSDDDAQDVNIKRVSNVEGNRKRRVVLDYSDEEFEDVVNIASPDYPKGKPCLDLKQTTKTSISGTSCQNPGKRKEETKVKEDISSDNLSKQLSVEDSSPVGKSMNVKTSSSDKLKSCVAVNNVKEKDSAPNSPKRRKVLKTRIDDRGREVTEVVWEGEETEKKKVDSNATKKVDNSTATNAMNRQPAVKKSPAAGQTTQSNATGKTGSKKTGNPKDPKGPKQGNILSFFKRV